MLAENLRFDAAGLIPAIVQDARNGHVLTLAYMNRESLEITLAEGRTCFWSRSRQELWRKGATSGNTQRVVEIKADCDGDALLVKVEPAGPACHTGKESCFFMPLEELEQKEPAAREETGEKPDAAFSLKSLYALLEERKAQPREGSYTSYLFAKGREKILKKVGEECAEVLIAAMKADSRETIFEVADLCYHVLVLMAEMDITPGQVQEELAGRHVVDKKVKQEPMA